MVGWFLKLASARALAGFSLYSSKTYGFLVIAITLMAIFLPISIVTPRYFENETGDHAQYCTIFSLSLGDKVFFGSNEDYRFEPETSFISFIPPQEIPNTIDLPSFSATIDIYGQVVVGAMIDKEGQRIFCPQGGMNNQGLCFGVNSIPEESLDHDDSDWLPLNAHWDVLWHCRTVDDVINWYQTHPVENTNLNGQWNYVDASGAGVVVTVTEGELSFVGKENNSYLISTNFNRADPSSHYFDYPCWRYDTASDMLEEIDDEEDLTLEVCRDVLDATHFEKNIFNDIQTLYSTIYDPIEKKIYLYFLHDFENVVIFDLEEEYSKVDTSSTNYSLQYKVADETYLMKEFFNYTNLDNSSNGYLAKILLGIGIPIIILIALVVFLKKKHSDGV